MTGEAIEERSRGDEVRRFARLAGALTRTAGAAAAERALPLFGGIGIAAAILFAGNGMDARDVVALAGRSPPIRLALWAAWIAAATPAARALLGAPAAIFLRSLPFPRWLHLAIAAAHVLALQAPWALLWGAGGGPARGLAAALVAAGIEAMIVARPRAFEWIATALLALGALSPLPSGAILAGAIPLFAIALRAAWIRAADRAPSPLALVGGPAPIALALSYNARLVRAEPALLIRGAFVALAGGALAGVAARNNDALAPAALAGYSLAITAMFLAVGAGGLAGPVRAAEREIAWILDTTAAGSPVRAIAARGAVAAWGEIGRAHV